MTESILHYLFNQNDHAIKKILFINKKAKKLSKNLNLYLSIAYILNKEILINNNFFCLNYFYLSLFILLIFCTRKFMLLDKLLFKNGVCSFLFSNMGIWKLSQFYPFDASIIIRVYIYHNSSRKYISENVKNNVNNRIIGYRSKDKKGLE